MLKKTKRHAGHTAKHGAKRKRVKHRADGARKRKHTVKHHADAARRKRVHHADGAQRKIRVKVGGKLKLVKSKKHAKTKVRALKKGEKVLAEGIPHRPEGHVTYQLGDKLVSKKMNKGYKKKKTRCRI